MTKKYFILDIKEATHNKYDEIAMVYANPVMEREICGHTTYSAVDHYCSDTETFIIPDDRIFINPIIMEAQHNNGVWEVDLSDYSDDVTFNESLGRRTIAHLFKGF